MPLLTCEFSSWYRYINAFKTFSPCWYILHESVLLILETFTLHSFILAQYRNSDDDHVVHGKHTGHVST